MKKKYRVEFSSVTSEGEVLFSMDFTGTYLAVDELADRLARLWDVNTTGVIEEVDDET